MFKKILKWLFGQSNKKRSNVIDYSKAMIQDKALEMARQGFKVRRTQWADGIYLTWTDEYYGFRIWEDGKPYPYDVRNDGPDYVSTDWHIL